MKIIKFKIQNSKFKTNSNFKFYKFLNKVILAFTIIFSFELCALNLNRAYAQDKIVAIVNNDIITERDLNDFINFTRIQLSKDFSKKEVEKKINSLKPDLLQRLIEDRLILQQAKKNNVLANENVVKARINDIKKNYPSEADFQKDLANNGLVQADIEKRIREQMLMYNIVDEKVRRKIDIRPHEITDFYETNKRKFVSAEERVLTVIILENIDVAKTIHYELSRGTKIEELANKYPLTLDHLTVKKEEDLKKEINDIVFKLDFGETSNPVQIEGKAYLFKLEEVIPSKQLNLAEAQDKIYDYLFERKMQEEMTKWLDEIKKESYIKIAKT